MVSVIKGKIHPRPFQVNLKDINAENIAKFKLEHVIKFIFQAKQTNHNTTNLKIKNHC